MANNIDAANKYRNAIGSLLSAYGDLLRVNQEYIELDLGNALLDSDFVGSDISKAEFVDGVAASQAVMAAIDTNGTNLYKVSDGSHR